MKAKIRKGDRVRVMRGAAEDVDKIGEVIRVLPKEERVVVQGVNIVKKHQKQTQSGGRTIPSGINEFEGPIHISNVALVDDASEKEAKAARAKVAKAKKGETKAEKPAEKVAKTSTRKAPTGNKKEENTKDAKTPAKAPKTAAAKAPKAPAAKAPKAPAAKKAAGKE